MYPRRIGSNQSRMDIYMTRILLGSRMLHSISRAMAVLETHYMALLKGIFYSIYVYFMNILSIGVRDHIV